MKINPHDRKANAFLNVVGTRSNQKRLMPSKTSKYGVGFGHSTQAGGDKSVNAKRANSAYRRDGSLTLNRQRSSTGQVAFRPVHASSRYPLRAMSKWLSVQLDKKLCSFRHVCKSSMEVIRKLKDLKIPASSVFLINVSDAFLDSLVFVANHY